MSAQIALYGRLGADPVERTSAGGKPWASASIAVNANRDEGATPLWLKLVAFGPAAEALARHQKGDLVSATGRLQVNRWLDREGKQREDLQVVAEQVISGRTVRPGGGKRRGDTAQQPPADPTSASEPALDDEIPF